MLWTSKARDTAAMDYKRFVSAVDLTQQYGGSFDRNGEYNKGHHANQVDPVDVCDF